MRIKSGEVHSVIGFLQEYSEPLVDGLVATDGVQYSSIATFGTTAVEILNKRIDPGVTMKLKELYVSLTQSFTGLNGSFVASMMYHWQVRPDDYLSIVGSVHRVMGAYTNIAGTYRKAVGTLAASEDTFTGYIPVGSVAYAPIRLVLTAIGIQAAVCQGRVKNSSIVKLVGNIIPGA